MANRGKEFEGKFKEDFLKISPDVSIDRLYDPSSGYSGIKNICDFICYIYPNIFYIECKSSQGNTWPLANLTQYDKLLTKVGLPGVRSGVVLWMIDHEVVVYLPVKTVQSMKEAGKKSFNIKDLAKEEFRIIQIPSKKKRVFLDSDYSILHSLEEGD